MKLLTIVASLLLATALPAFAERGAPSCLPSGTTDYGRPDQGGGPTHVRVGLYILDVVRIEEATESFTVDFLLVVRWRDDRLSRRALGHSLAGCLLSLDQVWHPRIGIVNQRQLASRGDEILRVDDAGNVDFRVGYFGDLGAPLDLHRFPFDSQRLGIAIASDHSPSDVELVGDPETTGLYPRVHIAGWNVVRVDDAPLARAIEAAGTTYPVTEFAIWIEREKGYYYWKVFLPLTLILAMAALVFWLDPRDYSVQIGVSTASVFTLIAFLLSLGRYLPRVSYLTSADLFLLGALVLVFAALAECVVTSRLAQTGRADTARVIDRWARWFYLGGYLSIIGLALSN